MFWIVILWVIAHVVGREARWQEGCRCHGDIKEGVPVPKRRRMIGDVLREDRCPFKGRRAVENVCGRLSVTIVNIRSAGSATLTQLFARMKEATRTRLLSVPSRLKEGIVAELSYKMKFYTVYPWFMLEILCPLFGSATSKPYTGR